MNIDSRLKKIVITSILIATTLVAHQFTVMTPLGTIGISGPFMAIIPVIFGPIIGALAYAINDILGVIIKPMGPYMWQYTAAMMLKGFMIGAIYKGIMRVNKSQVLAVSIAVLLGCLVNTTINTFIFAEYFDLVEKGIIPVLTYRYIEEAVQIVYVSITVLFMLKVMKRAGIKVNE